MLRSRRSAFTLIEMLVASVLAAVLMAGVLTAVAGVARDRQAIRVVSRPSAGGLADLIAWDLRTARTIARGPAADAVLVLVGNNGIRRATLTPDGRLVRVVYRTVGDDDTGNALWRQQEYLDDPARPTPWQQLVAGDFRAMSVQPTPGESPALVADKIRLDLTTATAAESREVTR